MLTYTDVCYRWGSWSAEQRLETLKTELETLTYADVC
jgi:hypothetical protein